LGEKHVGNEIERHKQNEKPGMEGEDTLEARGKTSHIRRMENINFINSELDVRTVKKSNVYRGG